jgi:hypothetical protein
VLGAYALLERVDRWRMVAYLKLCMAAALIVTDRCAVPSAEFKVGLLAPTPASPSHVSAGGPQQGAHTQTCTALAVSTGAFVHAIIATRNDQICEAIGRAVAALNVLRGERDGDRDRATIASAGVGLRPQGSARRIDLGASNQSH